MRTPKDWGQPCPNPACVHSHRKQQGNVSAIATYLTQSGKRRILRCHPCETQGAATRETVFCDLRTTEDKGMMALKMLRVRVDLAGISFVLGVTEETVLAWLRRVAHQAEAVNRHLLRTLPVPQVQRDEMWNFIARQHAHETDEAGESGPDGEDGRQGIWVSFAPAFRLMIAAVVGPRTLAMAQEGVAVTTARVAGIPACFSDGFTCYRAARIAAFHVVTTCARTGKRGRPRKPLCAPHPDLVYGQLVTQKKQGQLLTRSTRVVLGAERLTHLGGTRQHGLGRTGQPDVASGLGTMGAEDVQLLSRPRAYAAARGLLPGVLPRGQTAHELAAAVATAGAHTPRGDVPSMAGAHASNGGRIDGSRLDLA